MQNFPERLDEIRGKMSRSAFANAIGVSEGAVRTYYKGSIPSLEVALRIAEHGEVSLDWLTGRDNSHKHLLNEGSLVVDENVTRTINLAGKLIEKIAANSKRIFISPTDFSKTFVDLLHYVVVENSNEEAINNIVDFQIKKRSDR